MTQDLRGTVTRLLAEAQGGDLDAKEQLGELLGAELLSLAERGCGESDPGTRCRPVIWCRRCSCV